VRNYTARPCWSQAVPRFSRGLSFAFGWRPSPDVKAVTGSGVARSRIAEVSGPFRYTENL